ncbi:MAG: thermonuclease family protein [Halioglobus sp.]|nr:thermonuclease family protein [Halioglobus sp.]
MPPPPFPRRRRRRPSHTGKPQKPRNRLVVLAILLGLFSLYQYLESGSVRWPSQILGRAEEQISDYPTRPEAGWRRAGEVIESMGERREGRPVPDFDLTGRAVRIADGDTISLLDAQNQQHKVRFFGIDTPERDQPHGDAARRALAQLVEGKNVGVVVVTTDDYQRIVGTVYVEDTNINLAMVANGHAWWYRYYAPHERALEAAEQAARNAGIGLWASERPVAPWDWRRGRRQ